MWRTSVGNLSNFIQSPVTLSDYQRRSIVEGDSTACGQNALCPSGLSKSLLSSTRRNFEAVPPDLTIRPQVAETAGKEIDESKVYSTMLVIQ